MDALLVSLEVSWAKRTSSGLMAAACCTCELGFDPSALTGGCAASAISYGAGRG